MSISGNFVQVGCWLSDRQDVEDPVDDVRNGLSPLPAGRKKDEKYISTPATLYVSVPAKMNSCPGINER